MKRFYVFSAGCIRRGLDTIRIQKYFEYNGWKITNRLRRADMIVISTCGVVQLNEMTSLKAIEKSLKRKSPSATVVVSGCLPKINPEDIRKLGDVVFVPTGEFEKFDQIIDARLPFSSTKPPDSIADNPGITNYLVARSFCRISPLYKKLFYKYNMDDSFLRLSVLTGKVLGYIKNLMNGGSAKKIVPYYNIEISRGCLSNCSYCATKLAIGNVHSWPPERIVDELKVGLSKGYRFFQLISDDNGCYGMDIGTNLPNLLDQLFQVEGNYQLIIIDYNPFWLVKHQKEMIPLMVKYQDKIKEIFVPLQSGSDRILKIMRRDYTADQVRPILKEISERAPGISLRTTLLIGFPGESDEDFEATKDFISEINFAEVTVNRYEDRPNTSSLKMSNKVEQETIEMRAKFLAENMNCHILS